MSIIDKLQAKPFLKWAGGKGQLISQMQECLPKDLFCSGRIKNYFEPFLGGGAVFFWLASEFDFENIYLYEINSEVANCYRTIKNRINKLVSELGELEREYFSQIDEKREKFYYSRRAEYNELILSTAPNNTVRKAALLLFLNKTCFNGLYRVNSKGEFNVPFGRYKNPNICNESNLFAVKEALKNAEIINGDFSKCLQYADSQSFVYFDPPYRPLSQTASFTSYCQDSFSDSEQVRLKEVFDALDKKGALVMLSNSDPKNIDPKDNYFDDLYREYEIVRLKATRMINCNASKRGEIKEILVRNY
ncbi:MAG: DNA adenine methylase [Candidatus Omnitrophica bacterium]|nr:DNA adenine methylase [Candidatus Omnitrophota bacterium]